jgi:phosphoribosyl-AMP cyclohydrolase / phosphoribosyl-ATP pyrophosphohydrolase
MRSEDFGGLDFAKGGGLLPAVVQHADDGTVLMLGYMTREALQATLERRRVVFFSRSTNRLWEKGESSGNSLEVINVRTDCDRDALLIGAKPKGPTCHLGMTSCFGQRPTLAAQPLSFLTELERIIDVRRSAMPGSSYTARLFDAGVRRIAQKVGEEGTEVALAAVVGSEREVVSEAADLVYHLVVLLRERDVGLAAVVEELRTRHRSASPTVLKSEEVL